MRGQVGDETIGTAVAEKDREAGDALPVRRQLMRLRVVDHLRGVPDTAQKTVVFDQRLRWGRIDTVGRGEPAQRLAGRPDAQLRHPPAPDQLLRLGKEFDLADAAAANLDVVALDGDPAATAKGVDLALDRVNVLDRRKIEMFA